MKKASLFLILFLFVTLTQAQTVVINEFMAKNTSTIQDKDGDFSDWIEIYNTSNSTINLLAYSISDDISDLGKWTFPDINISPKSYLLIFASDKNILDTTELHTNFKISSGGEELFLSNNVEIVIDQTSSINLTDDESYCRVPDGNTVWLITDNSSPGASNDFSNQLIFSNQEGFYSLPFTLAINSYLGDTIYYTLDGSIPTEDSNIFADSLSILNKNTQPNIISEIPTSPEQDLIAYKAWESPSVVINKATTLRCSSFRNDMRTSKIYTKTYFVDDEIFDKYSIPIISLITDEDHLFDYNSGLYVPGVHFNMTNPEWTGNYFMRSDSWEREVHIEYFDQEGNLGFSQDAGIRIQGGKTRQAAQKSLRLYARNEYGKKYFNYNLLPNRQVDQYKRFLLRTTMAAWVDSGEPIITDVLAQTISSSLNIDYQEFQPVIVYVNGEYWGIHTIRDRIDERYIEYIHDIDKDSVEFKGTENIAYDSLMLFIEHNNLEQNSHYEYVKTQIDIDNYIDYTIAELFFKNYDWPVNNMEIWRKIPNGKWRWILYDLDAGFNGANYNMILHATRNDSTVTWPNPPSSTFLFRNLLKNENFKSQFINRYAEILNNDFDSDKMINKLDSIKELYSPEIPDHMDRWNYPNTYESWEEDIANSLLSFIEKRSCVVRENIMEYFNLTEFNFDCNTKVNNPYETDNIVIAPNPNNGEFFLLNKHIDLRNASIIITNINGQLVYREGNIDLMRNEKKYFELSYLPNNLYMLQIISNDYSVQMKIIKTN